MIIEPLMVCWYQFYSGLRMVGSVPTLSTASAARAIVSPEDAVPRRARPVVPPVVRAVRPSARTILAMVPSARRSGRRNSH